MGLYPTQDMNNLCVFILSHRCCHMSIFSK
jgi:hypothetical protein